MKKPGIVKIPSFLNSRYFESHFFERMKNALKQNNRHVLFDMRSMVWSDLKELLCIPLVLSWLISNKTKVDLTGFRPFFSKQMESHFIAASNIEGKPRSSDLIDKISHESKYKSQNSFFWGSLVPLNFFRILLGIDASYYLEDALGRKTRLNESLANILTKSEKESSRFYGITSIAKQSEVDITAAHVTRMMQHYDFKDNSKIAVFRDLINNTGQNIIDHAYHRETPTHFKKGFLAETRIYVCTEHTPSLIDQYFESLDPIFSLIKECETGRSINGLLEGPICHTGFKRLN